MLKHLAALLVIPSAAFTADWPQWHGPARDCVIPAGSPLPAALPTDLSPAWKINVGGGFAAPIVAGKKLIYLDEDGSQEWAHCLDSSTGKELWKVAYAPMVGDEWGKGPRSTPAVDGDRLFVLSMSGEFRALSLADGKTLWGFSIEKDYATKYEGYQAKSGTSTRRGNNGAVLVDGDAVIVPIGAVEGATLGAFDKATGKLLWKSGTDEAAYSAPMVADIAGRRQVIHLNADALTGTDRKTGAQLWRVPVKTGAKRHAATPLIIGDTVIINTFTVGLLAWKIEKDGTGFKATEAWKNADLKINLATPALLDGHLFSQGAKQDFVCVDAATGVQKWSAPGFGLGKKDYTSALVAGKNLLVLTEDGTLVLAAGNSASYKELGRLQVCGNTWCFPAYVDGSLYVRDGKSLARFDIAGGKPPLP